MGVSLVAPPWADIADAATGVTVTTEHASYLKANLYNRLPHKPYKATGVGTTIAFTFAAPVTLECVSLHNTNLDGAVATCALTNNNGLSSSVVLPAKTRGGRYRDPWRDLRTSGGAATASVWTFTIASNSANVAIGEIGLWDTLTETGIKWGMKKNVIHRRIQHRTQRGIPRRFDLDTRYATFQGEAGITGLNRDMWEELNEGAKGTNKGFLFVLDEDVNETFYTTFAEEEFTNTFDTPDWEPTDVLLEQWCTGRPL